MSGPSSAPIAPTARSTRCLATRLSSRPRSPATKATIGGLYLGLRQRDFTLSPPPFVNPAPAAGALVGKLTINGGTLTNNSTADSTFGADGRIVVGADGRGFLTMTGGTLNGQQLVVGGENFTSDALGTSLVDLSGSATLAIANTANAINGTATLDRRLKITGPTAKLTTGSTVTFGSGSSFSAVITSAANPAGPAMIQSGSAVKLSGALNVEFSGAGATGHTIGNKWNLISATTGVANTFTNLGVGNEVAVAGLAAPAPTGSAYYIRTVNNGSGKLVQLSYEGVLVLNVNRNTGEMKITNPLGGAIAIDSYQVTSARGSMLPGYAGLGTTTPGAGDWIKSPAVGGNSVNGLYEVKVPDMTPPIDNNDAYNLTAVPSVSLGTGFSRTGVAANIANFGNDGEDLIFSYSSPDGGIIRGQIVYEGTKFENDLVLRVNPNTGQAFLKNDSLQPLKLDGFSILSSTGALNGAGFTGLGGGWQTTSPSSANALTQTNLLSSTSLAPGAQLALGDISSTNFTTQAAKDGLSLQFLLTPGGLGGDYNSDGSVDAADYTILAQQSRQPSLVTKRPYSPASPKATTTSGRQASWKERRSAPERSSSTRPPALVAAASQAWQCPNREPHSWSASDWSATEPFAASIAAWKFGITRRQQEEISCRGASTARWPRRRSSPPCSSRSRRPP